MRLEQIMAEGSDVYHLGNFFMDFMDQNPDDCIWQIDAASGESETKASVLSRSIQLARCLRTHGLRPGDVIVVSGWNHLDVHIPFYAAFLNGLPLAGIDPTYKYDEIKQLFETVKPKLVFCEVDSYDIHMQAARELCLDVTVVTFGDGDYSIAKFLKANDDHSADGAFEVAKFDTNKVYAWLVSTSGTTGLPKVAAFKHQDIIRTLRLYTMLKEKEIKPALNLSSVQWISSYLASLSMITANHIKVQTSAPVTVKHAIAIINKYKPVVSTGSPNLFAAIATHEEHCDVTCFNKIVITGSPIKQDLLNLLKLRMRPDGAVWNLFAQTECVGPILWPAPDGPPGNVGLDLEMIKTQLVDPKTGEVIREPNRTGELWCKGPRFTEYVNNPEATAAAFTSDGWYKTGDLLFRDEKGYYFYVDRLSSAFKVGRFWILPMEIEQVIRRHEGVSDVCVAGIQIANDKQAVAVVTKKPGFMVTEDEIKSLVADTLSVYKQLGGGVVFVESLPRTISGKVARGKVLHMLIRTKKLKQHTLK